MEGRPTMSESLETLIAAFQSLAPVMDEDGEPVALEILPPATVDQKAAFASACGGQLPAELDAFLSLTAGLRGLVDFEPKPFLLEDDFIHTLRVFDYGNGDGLGLEVDGDRCRVWWLGHDPYFIVLHAQSITELLERWLDRIRNLSGPYLNAGELFFDPATESPALDKGRGSAGSDAALAAFLKELPEGTLVHDLRSASGGTEIPFDRLHELSLGSTFRRQDLVFAFLPPPAASFTKPVPVTDYLNGVLSEDERRLLTALPKGCLVIHDRDMAANSWMKIAGAYPDQDFSYKPPFHVLYPRRKSWWQFW